MKDKIMANMTKETQPTIVTPLDKTDNALSEVFNTEPMVIRPDSKDILVQPSNPTESEPVDALIEVDANGARGNLYQLLQQGQDALTYAIDLAKQSDKPSAFEAVSNMIKTLAETNMQLLDLLEKKQKLTRTSNGKITKEEASGQAPPAQVTNNSIFVGSTAELAKMLDKMKGGE
jgi:hypothetical protein